MKTPTEVIAGVDRDAENDAEYSVGITLAFGIVEALDREGYKIVPKASRKRQSSDAGPVHE